ncbi:MAG: glycerol-3-phosphate acyltransferase [Clostridia bacterium]|nr:glycerol-3-phosphate acyltransferase [Clostridia bacterium]
MKILFCMLSGYLLGSLSPAALIAKIKKKNLKESGTGNLGAMNTMLIIGKKFGALVMLLDILKAICAYKLGQALFPLWSLSGLVAGGAAVAGHIFPFYLKFKGGKGLAPFAGVMLAYDPLQFVVIFVFAIVLMLIVNYTYVVPFSACALFPIGSAVTSGSLGVFVVTALISLLVLFKHAGNRTRARAGEDLPVRNYIKNNLFGKGK